MPRVAPLNFGPDDIARAKTWLIEQAPSALNAKLDHCDTCPALINPQSKSKYNIALVGGRENNALSIPVTVPNILPLGGGDASAQWLGVVESTTSEVHLMPYVQFRKLFDYTINHGGNFQGFSIAAQGDHQVAKVNLGWAAQQNLIAKTICFGKDDESFFNWRAFAGATKEQFVNLHNHSYYSMLDGVAAPEDLVRAAVQNGQPGIALTDHGYMHGLYKLDKACREYEIKGMYGCEIYLVDDVSQKYTDARGNIRRFEYHLTLIAMDQEGWENLCTMMSIACKDHFYYVPRVGRAMLQRFQKGLLCLTGCFKGPGQFHLQQYESTITEDVPWYRFDPNLSRQWYMFLKETFGDRCYGEIHLNDYGRYMNAVPTILQMQADCGLKTVVAQDAHYSVTEDALLQSLLSRINQNKADDIGAEGRKTGPYYIRSRTEIDYPLFTPDMFDRSCEIMERCTLSLENKLYLFPAYNIKADRDWASYSAAKQDQLQSTGA